MPGVLYADVLALCNELEEDLTTMLGRFVEMWRRRGSRHIRAKPRTPTTAVDALIGDKEQTEKRRENKERNREQVSFVLPTIDDTCSPGYPPLRVVYPCGFHPSDFLPFP